MKLQSLEPQPSDRQFASPIPGAYALPLTHLVSQVLRQMYPGQFPTLKLNLFNVVLAVDLSQLSSVNYIATTVQMLINRGLPFRWGVAPIVETQDGACDISYACGLVEKTDLGMDARRRTHGAPVLLLDRELRGGRDIGVLPQRKSAFFVPS